MAPMGAFSDTEKNAMLNAWSGRAAYTQTPLYVQLHTGSPGAAGTSNVSTETTRQAVTMGTNAAAGAIASTAAVSWNPIALGGTETLTHVSFWSASTGGTFKGADDLPAGKVVQNGDVATIASGAIGMSITGTLP